MVPTPSKTERQRIQEVLEHELRRFQRITGRGIHLNVLWKPDHNTSLSGEVKNGQILIYEFEEIPALMTLRHEFIDFILSQAINPYRDVANHLIKLVNEDAYRQKEQAVEALTRLVSEETRSQGTPT